MSSLPPYSTYRTDSKQMMFPQATSHGNILTFTPPGFSQSLNVKFPDSRLAVCEKCKKNFKTRDMCRVRNTHTAAPWTTAYICITMDDSCTDINGAYKDTPLTVRMVQWQPFCVKKPFDPKTPVCASCKRTNRTRSFCRERHKHRQLPWCTVYVLLSALESTDPSTVVAGASKKVEDENDNGVKQEPETDTSLVGNEGQDVAAAAAAVALEVPENLAVKEEGTPATVSPDATDPSKPASSDTVASDGLGDDINDIAESRTFLAKVSCRSTTIHWLELADFDQTEAPYTGLINTNMAAAATAQPASSPEGVAPPPHIAAAYAPPGYPVMAMPAMDPNYYAHFAAQQQQHQVALKSHQQYFFQMQQQPRPPTQPPYWHTPPYPPPPYPAPQAQQQPQQPVQQQQPASGAGESSSPVTAGEAAAEQQRRQQQNELQHPGQPPPPAPQDNHTTEPAQQPPPQPPWPIYYPPGYFPPPPETDAQFAPPDQDAAESPEQEQQQQQQQPQQEQQQNGEEVPDAKRRRVEDAQVI